jgi:hypothetical protein
VLGQSTQVPIGLRVPVRKSGLSGQILSLIDVIAAQTSGIEFLQTHNVEVGNKSGYAVEIFLPAGEGQNVLPAACQIVTIAAVGNTDLYVVRQNP